MSFPAGKSTQHERRNWNITELSYIKVNVEKFPQYFKIYILQLE